MKFIVAIARTVIIETLVKRGGFTLCAQVASSSQGAMTGRLRIGAFGRKNAKNRVAKLRKLRGVRKN